MTISKQAQVIPLTLNEIDELKILRETHDTPGQQYLFQGPGVAEFRNLRSINPKALEKIEYYMHALYRTIEDYLREDVDREPNESELEEEIDNNAHYASEDYHFKKGSDEWDNFLDYMQSDLDAQGNTQLERMLVSAWETQYLRKLPDKDTFRKILQEVKKYRDQFEAVGLPIKGSIPELARAYITAVREFDTYDTAENFWYVLAQQTADMIEKILFENQKVFYQRKEVPEFPTWYDDKILRDEARDRDFRDQVEEWYKSYNHSDLKSQAQESISERDWESLSELKREMSHRYGFDPFEIFGKRYVEVKEPGQSWPRRVEVEYDPEDIEDERRDLPLGTVALILKEMEGTIGYACPTVRKSVQFGSMYLQAIKDILNSDRALKSTFSHDLNKIEVDPRNLLEGIKAAVESNTKHNNWDYLPIPEEFLREDWVASLRQQMEYEAQQAAERAEHDRQEAARQQAIREQQERIWRERLEREQAEREKYHHMLTPGSESMSEEQLKRMKELGIARRPFPHDYYLERGSYPGHGFSEMPAYMEPFTLSIAPTKEMVGDGKGLIPHELLQNLGLHKVKSPDQVPALGWVGGYADYIRKTLYVTEVQSDIMQRTGYMRHPQKVRTERESEVQRLQQKITDLQTEMAQLNQTKQSNPRQRVMGTIERIQFEQQALDPQSPRYIKNQQLLQNLQGQLGQMPDFGDPNSYSSRLLELRLQKLKGELEQAQTLLSKTPVADPALYRALGKENPESWHDYKGQVERTFSDWIRVFFNAIIREAKARGFIKVRVITADQLMKLWSRFGGPEKKKLFVRIYNHTAHFYNAKNMSAVGKRWFQIDLSDPNLRVARNNMLNRNWLNKIIKEANHWTVRQPNGRYGWQEALDRYFGDTPTAQQLRAYVNPQQALQLWINEAPAELKQGNRLVPQFEQAVREYMRSEYNVDPFENAVSGGLPAILQIHLDKFFENYMRLAPGFTPEFDTGEEYRSIEGYKEAFGEWLQVADPSIKTETGDLKPEIKPLVRKYLLRKYDFDPYEGEDDETGAEGIPTAQELEEQWG